MENLMFSLNATMPIFFTMVLGYLFRRKGFFDDAFLDRMNKFVFKVTLPALLFEDIAGTDFVHSWDGGFVLFCFCVTVLCILISLGISWLLKDRSVQGEFIQASYRSSAAILGIAFIQNIYGNAGMAPMMIIASVPLYNVCAVTVLSLFCPGRGRLDKKLIQKTLKGIATNPIILGILIGMLWSLFSLSQPVILQKTVHNLGVLTTPLGLMAMGGSFSFKEGASQLKTGILCAFLKLVGFVALFLPLAVFFGYRNDQLIAILVMLGSATTVTCFIMAKNMGYEGHLSSCVIALTTFFSSFTLTVWLYILKSLGFI
ncbi:MAG: AEC family transporter [Eubacteriales bacterium]|nr:AEC family transporter [Eubacteriales bacterium]